MDIVRTVKLNLRIAEQDQQLLKQAAAETDRSVSWCVREAIRQWLDSRNPLTTERPT